MSKNKLSRSSWKFWRPSLHLIQFSPNWLRGRRKFVKPNIEPNYFTLSFGFRFAWYFSHQIIFYFPCLSGGSPQKKQLSSLRTHLRRKWIICQKGPFFWFASATYKNLCTSPFMPMKFTCVLASLLSVSLACLQTYGIYSINNNNEHKNYQRQKKKMWTTCSAGSRMPCRTFRCCCYHCFWLFWHSWIGSGI